jgi:recombinational DNA repair protein RecT
VNNYKHRPALKDPGATIGALAVVKLPDGSTRCEWMDMVDLNNVRARSQSWINGGGPWKTDDGEMRKKTVIRRAMKMYTDDQPQVSKMMELDDRDYQAPRKTEAAPLRLSDSDSQCAVAFQAPQVADDPNPNPPNNNGNDPSEVVDDEASQRAGMEMQDAIDGATTAEEMAAVRAKLDAAQETLGDALYVAFLRMVRAKNKEIGVK